MTVNGIQIELVPPCADDDVATRSYLCPWDDRFNLADLFIGLGANIKINLSGHRAVVTASFGLDAPVKDRAIVLTEVSS